MQVNFFDELLSKEVTRREFLLHVGFLLFVLTGISGLLKRMADPNLTNKVSRLKSGFGSRSYGG